MEAAAAAAEGSGDGQRSKQPAPLGDRSWAWSVRQRLAVQLQETGHAEPKHVEELEAELVAVFADVLRRSSRRAWLRLMEALRLLAPFRHLLAGRPELLLYLEGLYYQYRSSRALVSDLDVLGALGRAFPQDRSVLGAPPQAACLREPEPLAKRLPSGPGEPVFAGLPCPFASDWKLADASGLLQPAGPVSLQELQRCLGPVGSAVSREEAPWASCLGLMSLSIATDVPVEYPPCVEPQDTAAAAEESPWEPGPAVPVAVPASALKKAAAMRREEQSMTGLQAVEVFVRNWRAGGQRRFLYLNVAPNRHFRPYDLVVVPKHLANPHHYIFSPFGVLRVHPEEGSQALTLGEWHRQAVLWQLMQHIPFFRLFLVRKAFVRWCCNVKHAQHLKHQEMLGCRLLQAVPHFGAALLHISRLLQELQAIHWLPQNVTKCFSFAELQRGLSQENSRAQNLLHRFLTLCSSILELVRDDTYQMVQGLQAQVQGYQLYVTKESLSQQRIDYEGLQRRLREAESWLQRLGFLALLVNFLICQSLVSIVQEEATAFVSHAMKADGAKRKAVIQVQLVFGPDDQLALFPSSKELEDCLVGSLDTVVESVLAVMRINSETPGALKTLPQAVPEQGKDAAVQGLGAADSPDRPGFSEPLQKTPLEELRGEEPQLVHRLNLKAIGGLEVVGHRLHGQYPLLSREQLEKDLWSDSIVQQARADQQALLGVRPGAQS